MQISPNEPEPPERPRSISNVYLRAMHPSPISNPYYSINRPRPLGHGVPTHSSQRIT